MATGEGDLVITILNGFGYFIGGAGILMLKSSVYRKTSRKYNIIMIALILVGMGLVFL